ncbi:MAG: epoxyqueuosine reductase QueH [bacterium]
MDIHKPKIFLHACCAPCLTYPYKVLSSYYEVTVFFYNPNIHPMREYNRRLSSVKKIADNWNFELIVASYDKERWFEAVRDLEQCKEGGKRCVKCYRFRLQKTAETAKQRGLDLFATTLTVSPLKKAEVINRLGFTIQKEMKINYLESNFKKKDGFKKSCQFSKQEGLYRQNYCGCIYSKRDSTV